MTGRIGTAAAAAGLAITAVAAPARAQQPPPPIGPFVVDVRASVPFYPDGPDVSTARGLPAGTLPGRGLGLTVGGHWYPLRWGVMTLGVGGELFLSRGRREPTAEEIMAASTTPPTIETRMTALTPQVSFNFGSGDGWSYISGGLSRTTLTIRPQGTAAPDDPPRARTINYGGGARWFDREHVAFTLDLRIYAVSPIFDRQDALVLPRTTVVVLNFGVGFK